MLSKHRKTLWIALILLASLAIAEQFLLWIGGSDHTYNISVLIALPIIAIVIGLGIALVPVRLSTFKQRLGNSLLPSFIVCLLISDIIFGALIIRPNPNLYYQGTIKDYKHAPTFGNCNDIRNGTFEDENMVIIRSGSRQTQFYKKSHRRQEMIVEWTGECEYRLIPVGNTKRSALVKITDVTNSGFTCISSIDGGNGGREYTFKRSE